MWAINAWRLVLFALILLPGFMQVCHVCLRQLGPAPCCSAWRSLLAHPLLPLHALLKAPAFHPLQMVIFYCLSPRLLRGIPYGIKVGPAALQSVLGAGAPWSCDEACYCSDLLFMFLSACSI